LWTSLSPLMLHHCLAAVMEVGLWVGSPAAVERLVSPPQSVHAPNDRGIVLSAHEQSILQVLAAGLRQRWRGVVLRPPLPPSPPGGVPAPPRGSNLAEIGAGTAIVRGEGSDGQWSRR
jgi:hypothetical protein